MPESPAINRKIELEPALDYALLRSEGLEHIKKLSSLIWTDHNTHDPGITSLEVLTYALTDLAYRTGFETRDLMTRPDGRMDPADFSGLRPPHEVLTTAPRTIADYRRLLLRVEGLRNAWLDPMTNPDEPHNYRLSEVPIFADCLADELSFEPVNDAGQDNHPVKISGLYKVLVELEIDDQLGSLNETALIYRVRRDELKGVVLVLDCDDPAFRNGTLDLRRDMKGIGAVSVSPHTLGFKASIELKFTDDDNDNVTLSQCLVRVIDARPRPDLDPVQVTAEFLRSVLQGEGDDDLVPLFWTKQQRRSQALEAVTCVLNAHRGLCEDFLSIDTVTPYHIGVCADIEVTPEADLELVQATVYHEIEKYMSAPVRYQSLEEMLTAGYQPDEIFNGPFVDFELTCAGATVFTKPGFITDEDLAASELRRTVHASDIINIVVDIEGVEAIRNLQFQVYDRNGISVGQSAKWSLPVPPDHQPVFYMAVSKILFHKSGIPYRAQVTEFDRTLEYLRGLDRRALYVPADQILSVPIGRWRHLDAFYSVQHDFPETYKIGPAGISEARATDEALKQNDHYLAGELPERIAQARQLKGYLSFFDQVLADYLGQLANLRCIYSLDKTLTRTWFSPYMTGIAGSLDEFEDEFYTDKISLSDEITRTRLNETEEVFLDRRNRVLDHLIARFAERFADYVLLSFHISGDRLKTSAQLIDDKIDFLAEYPRLSRERGQAANIRPQRNAEVWNSNNISGLERRVARLLGITAEDDGGNVLPARRNLHCDAHFEKLFRTQKEGDKFRLVIRDAANRILFSSAETFADTASAMDAAAKSYQKLRDEGAFAIAATQGTTTFTLSIVSGPAPLNHRKTFDTEADATVALRAIIDRYDELLASELCNAEGMHLVEHNLLRPFAKEDGLMSVCLNDGCHFCGEEDPYSFRISVVLPYWPERFRNLHFRTLFERTLRMEAPAHVQVKVCWIGQRQMTEFDTAYRGWLMARAAAVPNPVTIRSRAKKLIAILESLVTVYPAASLHDCHVGEDENLVRLGSTAIGIF